MRKISDYSEYRELSAGKKLHNNVFLPSQIKQYIADERLYAIEGEDGFLLLYNEKDYVEVISGGQIPDPSFANRLPDLKLVYHITDSRSNPCTEEIRNAIEALGFTLRCSISEYTAQTQQLSAYEPLPDGYEFSSSCNYGEAVEIWKQNLPIMEIPHMTREEFDKAVEEGRFIALIDTVRGKTAAVGFGEPMLKTETFRHLVVLPEYRKKGLGKVVVARWIQNMKENGRAYGRSWVEDENAPSWKIFVRYGFSKTDRLSFQFIKNF
ncbi:MAG: GNAT family N-acetyltransferase [Clostridia bacterium]|nr:GNAT family N-acetyltransferase [Clostridia bacterium]